MDVILKTENLSKHFGSKAAVNAVNLTVSRGDIYGFIGKNGAGKTTLMRMVVGTVFPTSGSISLFNGMPLSAARKKIGCLIEAPGFYRGCTAKENLRRMALLTGDREEKLDEVLALVGLSDTGSKKAGAFSLGMKQRLGIALALLGDPEFLVLDEPVNGLDPEGIKAIRDLVIMLNRERGITFLISSHLLDELGKIVTKYGIINEGTLVEEVDAEELKARTFDGLKIVTDNPEKAKELLLPFAPQESIRTEGGALFMREGYSDTAAINRTLVTSGLNVSELTLHSGGLEEYFIERIGK